MTHIFEHLVALRDTLDKPNGSGVQEEDLREVIDYLWDDELTHYQIDNSVDGDEEAIEHARRKRA